MDVFINDIAAFLPNDPVDNDDIEDVLGRINNIPSRAKRIVLRNNKIKTRYYALNPSTRRLTHSNAQLTAAAIRGLKPYAGFSPADIECLCCGTTAPDLLFPGHALMVLGELEIDECEAVTTAGICICGMTALKFAYMNVAAGLSANAVATGSELAASFLRADFMTPFLAEGDQTDLARQPVRAFDADFLRWMLSDGAGAVFLSDRPNPDRISLKIEWIDHSSFAGQLETCMYSGGIKADDGRAIGWRVKEDIDPASRPYLFAVRQDIKLLDKHIVATMGKALSSVVSKRRITPSDIDWFLPHYSSAYFRPKFYDEMKRIGFEIPYPKWFTNLASKGNTGSAAIFIILEEIFHSGNLHRGQKLLCFIPESGRFSHCFMLLTVV
ncbi:MAG: beta-ketoacyl-ACP synthase III [Desulfobacterales bacterium]